MPLRLPAFVILLLLGWSGPVAALPPPARAAAPYTWRNVAIGGGGFVTGLEFHPRERGLLYARTDVGGAYRWDAAEARWIPLLDWVGRADWNLHGIESLALDPTDPERVYLAAGTYTFPDAPRGEILRSRDRGRTWTRTVLPFKFGANEAGRGSGERLVVDPASPHLLYLGTRRDGLWRSADHGATWTRVSSFPDVPDDSVGRAPPPDGGFDYLAQAVGIVWVLLAPAPDTAPTRVLYAAVSTARTSVFRSTDAGATWEALPEQPLGRRPTAGALGGDGRLWLTYADEPGPNAMRDGAVWVFDPADGSWNDVTPLRPTTARNFGYAAATVDPRDPGTVLVTTWNRYDAGDEIFRTTDGGRTWRPLLAGAQWDHASAPYTATLRPHWMSDVEIDPFESGRALFTTGYGVWESTNLGAFDRGAASRWTFFNRNLEETVPLVLVSPPSGAPLLSGLGDVDGFVHHDLAVSPPAGRFAGPRFKNTEWMDYAGRAAEVLVRSGTTYGHDRIHAAYTHDGGAHWRELAGEPPAGEDARRPHPTGPVGVSADGRTVAWTVAHEPPAFSDDWGRTWRAAAGAPRGMAVFGDRVDPEVFSGYDGDAGAFCVSRDRGATFAVVQRGLPTVPRRDWGSSHAESDAVPGHAGEVWVVAGGRLYWFRDYGRDVRTFGALAEVGSVGLGAPPPGADYPAVFVVATIDGVDGLYRSDDRGGSWQRITNDAFRYGSARGLAGDPRVFGRVYFCTGGRGIVYGEPAADDER